MVIVCPDGLKMVLQVVLDLFSGKGDLSSVSGKATSSSTGLNISQSSP